MQSRTQHFLGNHTCEIDGDVAHAETYCLFASLDPEGRPLHPIGGRYIDRLERRNGRWAIAARKWISEWGFTTGEPWRRSSDGDPTYWNGSAARDKSDPSYDRPLAIDPARIGRLMPAFDKRAEAKGKIPSI